MLGVLYTGPLRRNAGAPVFVVEYLVSHRRILLAFGEEATNSRSFGKERNRSSGSGRSPEVPAKDLVPVGEDPRHISGNDEPIREHAADWRVLDVIDDSGAVAAFFKEMLVAP